MLGEIVIDSTNNQIVVDEGGGAITVTLTAGTYYQHWSTDAFLSDYPSLWEHIFVRLAVAGASNTYTVEALTVGNQTLATMRLISSAAVTWSFASASFTLSPRYFGFDENESSTVAVLDGGSGDYHLDGDRTAWGLWRANALHDGTSPP